MKKNNIIFNIILVLLLIATSLIAWRFIRGGDSGAKLAAQVTAGGEVSYIELDTDSVYYIEGDLHVTLIVENGEIFFSNSLCPDHLCEGFGKLSKLNDVAVCMPARVSVQIVEHP